jgi:hypothetical protein
MEIGNIVRVVGSDFHYGDTMYVGNTGRVIEVIEEGWCEGCVVVDLGDDNFQTFFSDDVEKA